jgi:2Fe-2S ferredoxin
MTKVTFLPINKTVEFDLGSLPYGGHGKPRSLLDVALNFDVPLEHTCGGNCACTTCHLIVRQGEEYLSALEENEADRLDLAAGVTLHSRLGCQAVIAKDGEIVVEIPAGNRNHAA